MAMNPLQLRLAQLLHTRYGQEHAGEAAYVLLHARRWLDAALPSVLPAGATLPTLQLRWHQGTLQLQHASPAVRAALRPLAGPLAHHVAAMLGRPADTVRATVAG